MAKPFSLENKSSIDDKTLSNNQTFTSECHPSGGIVLNTLIGLLDSSCIDAAIKNNVADRPIRKNSE